jgi:hypothetical protein
MSTPASFDAATVSPVSSEIKLVELLSEPRRNITQTGCTFAGKIAPAELMLARKITVMKAVTRDDRRRRIARANGARRGLICAH